MNNAWFFLSKPYIFIISLYCFFIYLGSVYRQLEHQTTMLSLEQPNAIISYDSRSPIKTHHLAYIFILSLLMVSGMYAVFYRQLLQTLRNADLYFQYWRRFRVGNAYPMPYLYMMCTSYSMIYIYVMDSQNTMEHFAYENKYMTTSTYYLLHFLLGELSIITYFLLLPKFISIHLEILRVMNENAEY
jgi:hypothetical protein